MIERFVAALCIAFALVSIGRIAGAQTLQDIGLSAGVQCHAHGVNDAGQVVGRCTTGTSTSVAFLALSPGSPQILPGLVANGNCTADLITDSGMIVGNCQTAAGVGASVIWMNSAAITAPIVPSPLLGGVLANVTAVNRQGRAVGYSIDTSNGKEPVIWSTDFRTSIVLPGGGLLSFGSLNCEPTDVTDATGAGDPTVVGVCPSAVGALAPVVWSPGALSYVAALLPLPSDASWCTANVVNASQQIMGNCFFPSIGVLHTVRWPNPVSAPIVLTNVNGNPFNLGVDMNAGGQIVGGYLESNGYGGAYRWDPAVGPAVALSTIAGGSHTNAVAIGDNANTVGQGETASGTNHAFAWVGTTVTDLGTLGGGANSGAAALSRSGCFAAGTSEASGETDHAYLVALCGPGSGARRAARQ
ncbi:hypothetical protein [Burkholderia alba]|uniref:hypothetical protein n=1 Tax=Burkholderia alba TaxID=2683677 RepID=UPI002B060C4E|nr:hypothetical protein [Burkholderia alba]